IRGEVDYLERVPADLLPLLDAKSGARAEVVSKFGFQAIMRMNHLQPPFDNPKARQAIARAVDRAQYAAVVAGDPSFATDCAAMCPPWWPATRASHRMRGPCSAVGCFTRAGRGFPRGTWRPPSRC